MSYPDPPNGVRSLEQRIRNLEGDQGLALRRRVSMALVVVAQMLPVDERELWPQYMDAYQTVFERTSTLNAPWYVVPANAKWYALLAVQALLLDALEEIDPQWPAADFDVAVEKARLAAS